MRIPLCEGQGINTKVGPINCLLQSLHNLQIELKNNQTDHVKTGAKLHVRGFLLRK
jgi:hypothetical protein